MKRPGFPPRHSSIARTAITGKRARIRRNGARQAKNLERAHGPVARREWIRSLPSVVSGLGPCENVHVCTGGVSRKADARFVVPLTSAEHRELHQSGIKTFQAKYGVDLKREAELTDAKWRAHATAA